MELIRGRWSRKYINCWEDKRDYDIMRRASMPLNEIIASEYCKKFDPPQLTASEIQEITDYWAQYGIKITDLSWHRMYYHATGNHDPRFVPDPVAAFIIYEYYNERPYEITWRDKNYFQRLLPNVPLPKEIGRRVRGRYFHETMGYLSNNDENVIKVLSNALWDSLGGEDDIVIKTTRTSGFGKGVKKFHISCEGDIESALNQYKDCSDYVVQICVRQHSVMASLNPKSSNVMRICSWRHDNKVDIFVAGVRVAATDSFTDVSFVNGEELVNVVGITADGYLEDQMIDQDGRFVRSLPTGIKVPSWEKIVEIIKTNHLYMDNFDVVGWDFTVDENGYPVCFEWNIFAPGTVLYQYANKRPLFGEFTDEIFSFLKDEKNRDNYIPFYMKKK